MNPKAPFKARSLNWDMPGSQNSESARLNPRDITQVAFLLEEDTSNTEQEQPPATGSGEKRFIIGQLNVQWRSAMGDRGSISTGWLTGKKR
jgi:trafficking protein particle complex subunit 13